MKHKTLFVIRGLPGAGKSSLAKVIAPEQNYEADDYFTDENGSYEFVFDKLNEAHKQCLDSVEHDMQQDILHIAVANTFTCKREIVNYYELAEEYNYSIFIIHCQNDFGSIHNVPDETVKRMKQRWQENIRQEK